MSNGALTPLSSIASTQVVNVDSQQPLGASMEGASSRTALPAEAVLALGVVLYGYDEWWLALPRSASDEGQPSRNCNWLYAVHAADATPPQGSQTELLSYTLKERVKVVSSSCFLTDIVLMKQGKTSFSLTAAEKERVDRAFAARLSAEADEQKALMERLAKEAEAQQKSTVENVKAIGGKRARGADDEDVATEELAVAKGNKNAEKGGQKHEVPNEIPAKIEQPVVVVPLTPEPVYLPRECPAPPFPCLCLVVLSLRATALLLKCVPSLQIPTPPSHQCLDPSNANRAQVMFWDGVGSCRMVEELKEVGFTPSGNSVNNRDGRGTLLHIYGPCIGRDDVRFVSTSDDPNVPSLVELGDASFNTSGDGTLSVGIAAFELRVEDGQSLMAKRIADRKRRAEEDLLVSSLPPPPKPPLVHIGKDNWAFSGVIVPKPVLPGRPKGLIPTPVDWNPEEQPFYHFQHNGVVHSVPIAAWNAKVSEISKTRFCRDTAKEAELAAKKILLSLQHPCHK